MLVKTLKRNTLHSGRGSAQASSGGEKAERRQHGVQPTRIGVELHAVGVGGLAQDALGRVLAGDGQPQALHAVGRQRWRGRGVAAPPCWGNACLCSQPSRGGCRLGKRGSALAVTLQVGQLRCCLLGGAWLQRGGRPAERPRQPGASYRAGRLAAGQLQLLQGQFLGCHVQRVLGGAGDRLRQGALAPGRACARLACLRRLPLQPPPLLLSFRLAARHSEGGCPSLSRQHPHVCAVRGRRALRRRLPLPCCARRRLGCC